MQAHTSCSSSGHTRISWVSQVSCDIPTRADSLRSVHTGRRRHARGVSCPGFLALPRLTLVAAQGHATWGGHKIMRPAKSVRGNKNVTFENTSSNAERDVEAAASSDGTPSAATGDADDDDDDEEAQMNTVSTIILLVISTILIGVTSEWLVDSISGITSSGHLSQAWVGLILLPIVGNAAEHVTAVTTGYKDSKSFGRVFDDHITDGGAPARRNVTQA